MVVLAGATAALPTPPPYDNRHTINPPLLGRARANIFRARRAQSWDRLRMTADSLERLECIGNWLRNGHIDVAHIITAAEDIGEMETELNFDSDDIRQSGE